MKVGDLVRMISNDPYYEKNGKSGDLAILIEVDWDETMFKPIFSLTQKRLITGRGHFLFPGKSGQFIKCRMCLYEDFEVVSEIG